MINIIININTKFVFIYKVWFSTVTAFFSFCIHFKNYRLINRYRPVWSKLAIGIGKIHYRSTSNSDYTCWIHILFNKLVCFLLQHVYDQKNIRRRVYDALNVLMAMNIISKDKKEIKWIGFPTNSAQECQDLEVSESVAVCGVCVDERLWTCLLSWRRSGRDDWRGSNTSSRSCRNSYCRYIASLPVCHRQLLVHMDDVCNERKVTWCFCTSVK